MSDLSKRLRGRVHDSQMDNEYMMDDAADELDAKDATIAELVEGFQSLGLKLMSEAAVCSRSGQMERLEALADDAFLRARALSKASQD